MKPARPFLKYAGGKTQLLPQLLSRMPSSYNVYYEPFLGGGALFFAARPRRAVLSDSNKILIRTYIAIQNHVEDVIERLKVYVSKHSEEFYYSQRDVFIDALWKDADIAAWMIYLNKTGFNGLYRVNKSGKFNVPFGKYKNPPILDEENLRSCSEVLKRAYIKCIDFSLPMYEAEKGDFIYCDPPYIPIKAGSFTAYSAEKFDRADHQRLSSAAWAAKSRGVNVLLSNSVSPVVKELYEAPSFQIETVSAKRSINSKGSDRGSIGEYLIR